VAPADSTSDGLDFFAASAGQDAAQLLHFDLGTVSPFLASPLASSGLQGETNDELTAGLMQYGGSGLELIAVFWAGSPDSSANDGAGSFREPSTVTTLYSPTEGQGSDDQNPMTEVVNNPRSAQPLLPDLSKVVSSLWVRFVSGIDAALTEPRSLIDVVSARDVPETGDNRPREDFARLDPVPFDPTGDPDVDDGSNLVGETLQLFWFEGRPGDQAQPSTLDRRSELPRGFEGIDAPAVEGTLETVPLISTALLLSGRLILNASTPRPPSFRKGIRHQGLFGLGDARPGRGRPDRA
jgi:hypothetical protein